MAPIPDGQLGASDLRRVGEDFLAAEQAVLSGALIGYARVSTKDQLLDRQIAALTDAAALGQRQTSLTGDQRRVRNAQGLGTERASDRLRGVL